MLEFDVTDLPARYFELETEIYGEIIGEKYISQNQFISALRESGMNPSNTRAEIVFTEMESYLKDKYEDIEVTYYINNMDTHFYINGNEISDAKDWEDAIAEHLDKSSSPV
jgi:hypothetical protein